ncbi:TolC family protein, partial [Verrucomicrobiales bacterium]|nr:TolC family protein [Verrucomicrobiales bacterium]
MRTSTTSPLLAALTGALLGLPGFTVAGDTFYGDPGGLLDLDDLINLALQSSPDVVRLQGRINTTRAEEKAASDWEDPELRVSYSRDHDVELPPSETETRRISSSETTQENRSEFERDNVNGSTTRSTRNSTTTTRTEEFEDIRITPGATSDRIRR